MRNVYLVECVDLHYVCEVCSSLKTACLAKKFYDEVIGNKQHVYKITPMSLIDSSFSFLFDIPKDCNYGKDDNYNTEFFR